MMFNTAFNNFSVLLWQSVLLLDETDKHYFSYIVAVSFIGGRKPEARENHGSVASH